VAIHIVNATTFTYPVAGWLGGGTPVAATGSPVLIGNPETQSTGGSDCLTVGLRQYGSFLYPNDSGVFGAANFVVPCGEQVRYWAFWEMNQGAAWTCGSISGHYDLLSIYTASESRAPVRVFNQKPYEADWITGLDPDNANKRKPVTALSQCSTFTSLVLDASAIAAFWLEHNASSGTCELGASGERLGYDGQFVVVKTPVESGVITATANSININGTEVLVQP
jgi:hypothetical protein